MANRVFVVTHAHESSPDREEIKFIGVYSTETHAKSAVDRLVKQPGFAETPEGFHIDAITVDKDHWTEGFVTILPKRKRQGKVSRPQGS